MSETGHAKNLANLSEIINNIQDFGSTYDPTNPEIQSDSLETLFSGARNAQDEVNNKEAAETTAISIREKAFEPLSKLITRVSNAFIGCGATSNEMVNFQEIARKIQGKRASTPPAGEPLTAGETPPVTISASQMSFENRVENLERLIEYIAANPKYSVNEEDLKPGSLRLLAADLRAKNAAVSNASVAIDNARLVRNRIFYNEHNGLIKTANLVKNYVKSVFGAGSPQYKQISGLSFKSIN